MLCSVDAVVPREDAGFDGFDCPRLTNITFNI